MHDSQFAINHFLRSKGFADLSEAGALMTQLAYTVRDDRHFASLLNACEPAERGHMYNALAPNLRFKARSLAEYMIDSAQDAERRQLPTIGEDGHFKEFKVPEFRSPAPAAPAAGSDDAIATAAVAEVVAKERLWVVCAVCTREDIFRGVTRQDALEDARKTGWRMAVKGKGVGESTEQVEVCPACVRARAPRVRQA